MIYYFDKYGYLWRSIDKLEYYRYVDEYKSWRGSAYGSQIKERELKPISKEDAFVYIMNHS